MGERTQYAPGTFSLTDLNTTDQEAAKAFYSGLFGWSYDDAPVGDDVYYSMASIDGKPVAAISPQPQQQREAGAPPAWNSTSQLRTPTRHWRARPNSARLFTPRRSTSWTPAGWASSRIRRELGSWSGSPSSTSAPVSSTRTERCRGTSSAPPIRTARRSSTVTCSAGRRARW